MKKLSKNNSDQITIRRGWFASLKQHADRYEKKPTKENKQILLGFIDSAEFIVKNY